MAVWESPPDREMPSGLREEWAGRLDPLKQRSPTLGLQMFLDYNSQKPSPPLLVARISGS